MKALHIREEESTCVCTREKDRQNTMMKGSWSFSCKLLRGNFYCIEDSKTAMNYVPIQKCIKNNRSLMTMAEQDYNQ